MKFHNTEYRDKVLKASWEGKKVTYKILGIRMVPSLWAIQEEETVSGCLHYASLRMPHPARMSGVREETCKIHNDDDENPPLHSLSLLVVRECAPPKWASNPRKKKNMESETQVQRWEMSGGVLRVVPRTRASRATRPGWVGVWKFLEAVSENRPLGAFDRLDSCIAW